MVLEEFDKLFPKETDRMFAKMVFAELQQATAVHGPFNSLHEAIAVIREEYLELEAEIFQKWPDKDKVIAETVQVAAMCEKLFNFIKASE